MKNFLFPWETRCHTELSHLRLQETGSLHIVSKSPDYEQAATQKAEGAASKAGGSNLCGHGEGLLFLQPILQTAKRRLDAERAADSLQKAVAASKSLSDLPKLEAAIIAARKVKGVNPDVLR